METYLKKLKHIIPTFLAVCLGTVGGLALIRWIFCLQFSILDIKEDVWTVWIPLVFPWLPITFWLRPRFRILTFKDEDKGRFGFQIISWLAIALVLFVSQAYLTTATGKLQKLTTIKEMDKVEKARYYQLADFAVAHSYGGSYTDFRVSGKYNTELNFDTYFVTPILSDTSERISGIPHHWYGVKYHKQISNKISDEEKEELTRPSITSV